MVASRAVASPVEPSWSPSGATTLGSLRRIAAADHDGARPAAALGWAEQLVGGELLEVRQRVDELVDRGPTPAREAVEHLMRPGGKAVRPLLTLLAARAVGGDAGQAVGCAVAAELAHNATLLHDDVIDDGQVRRGKPAARMLWGNTLSVLAGDLLIVTALGEAQRAAPGAGACELTETLGAMVEGEVLQLRHRGTLDLDLATYERIIECKTASLFRWCARAGGRAGGGRPDQIALLGRYGQHVGIAFQLRDDVLDLVGDAARMGKSMAADLAEGKLTLPVLVALDRRPELREQLRALSQAEAAIDADALGGVVSVVRQSGGLEVARLRMQRECAEAQLALGSLPPGPAVQLLGAVAEALVVRER